jgi:hypothetical protein
LSQKIVGGEVAQGAMLFTAFGFSLAGGVATLTARVCDFGALCDDLQFNINAMGYAQFFLFF